MPSQANTFGPGGGEFISDSSPQSVTLYAPGGSVTNIGSTQAWINVEGQTVQTTDGNNQANIPLPPNSTIKLPILCALFKHATASGSTFLMYKNP